MSRVLFNSGVMQFRSNQVQVIPSGSTADDCVCCGGGCNFCPDNPGGPFADAEWTQTITGLPSNYRVSDTAGSDVVYEWDFSFANGVYVLSTDGVCGVNDYVEVGTLSVTTREWGIGTGCASGTLPVSSVATRNYTLSVTQTGFSATVDIPAMSLGFRNFTANFTSYDECVGGTLNLSKTVNYCPLDGNPQQSITHNYSFSSVFNGL